MQLVILLNSFWLRVYVMVLMVYVFRGYFDFVCMILFSYVFLTSRETLFFFFRILMLMHYVMKMTIQLWNFMKPKQKPKPCLVKLGKYEKTFPTFGDIFLLYFLSWSSFFKVHQVFLDFFFQSLIWLSGNMGKWWED